MSLTRKRNETQRAFVERMLRENGSLSVYDVLYDTKYPDGSKASITRLAAIVWSLRHDGWEIETHDEHGRVAVYRLVSASIAEPRWACVECGASPSYTPSEVLGGMAQARCEKCHTQRYFRRAA